MMIRQPLDPFPSDKDKEALVIACRALMQDPNWLTLRRLLEYKVDTIEFDFFKENPIQANKTLEKIADEQNWHAAMLFVANLPQSILRELGQAVDEPETKNFDPYDEKDTVPVKDANSPADPYE